MSQNVHKPYIVCVNQLKRVLASLLLGLLVLPGSVGAQAVISAGSCYKIRLKKTNSPLQAMPDGRVEQQSQSNQTNQLWKAEDAGNSRYRFAIQDGTNRVITTPAGNDGDVMTMMANTGSVNQQWRLDRNNGDGSYRIVTGGNVTWDVQNYGIYSTVQLWGNTGEPFFDYRSFLFESANCTAGGGGGDPPPVTSDLSNIAGYVGINTSNTGGAKADGEVYRLAVRGKILAEEIRVRSGWADDVFLPGYRLATLAEIEQHIKQHGHLSEIPSAEVVEANGIQVGEMTSLLLRKIEELTLHLIRQQKQVDGLKQQIKRRRL